MIKINLLPDIKIQYINAQRTKYKFISAAVIVSIVFVALVALLAVHVHVVQVAQLNNKQKSIDNSLKTLQSDPDAVKVATLQNQLQGLTTLANQKPSIARMFGYLQELVPTNVGLNSVNVDPSTSSFKLAGTTNTYQSANAFSDILKHAQFNFQTNGQNQSLTPFSSIVFSNLGKSSGSSGGNNSVSFTVSMTYDAKLFDSSIQKPTIVIPELTSAHINQPSAPSSNTKPFGDNAPVAAP
jgi:hypothetical protein